MTSGGTPPVQASIVQSQGSMPRTALTSLIEPDEPTVRVPARRITRELENDETVRIPRAMVLEILAKMAPTTPRPTERDWDQLSAALLEIVDDSLIPRSGTHPLSVAVADDGEDVDLGDAAELDDSVWVEFE
jgi:hypothetical protein